MLSMDQIFRNNFATRAFRDVADMDYVSARTLYRNDCLDAFLVFSQQAIEKYLKGVLLYNSIKHRKATHDLLSLLEQCESIEHFKIFNQTREFIKQINGFDELRYAMYLFGAFSAKHSFLVDLDYSVMDIRRYCRSDHELARSLSKISEDQLVDITKKGGVSIIGVLEDIQKSKDNIKFNQLRSNLIWNNQFFSSETNKNDIISGWWAKSSGFDKKELKDSYEAVKDYVYMPKDVEKYFKNRDEE